MDFKEILEHHILDHHFGPHFLGLSKHLLMMWIAAGALILLFKVLFKSEGALARKTKVVFEMLVLFIRDDVVVPAMGEAGKKYLHYFLSLFFFILFCNLLGLIPGASTPTGNIAVTATLALCTFSLIHIAGIREHGVGHYIHSIVPSGLPGWLVPIMFPIELIGFLTKTFALSIRLFMNMIAGHIVILAFLGLIFIFGAMNPWLGLATSPVSVILSLFIYFLELAIVVPLQAFIFTFLTALFVGAAVRPEH